MYASVFHSGLTSEQVTEKINMYNDKNRYSLGTTEVNSWKVTHIGQNSQGAFWMIFQQDLT